MDTLGAARFPPMALLWLACSRCGAPEASPAAAGELCGSAVRCVEGLAGVTAVGPEYGQSATDDVCEHPATVYDFLHFGERGEDRRLDEYLSEGILRR